MMLDLPLQNMEVWEQETNPSPTSYRKEVNLKKNLKQNDSALLTTKPWVQAGAGDAAQPAVCTECLLQKGVSYHLWVRTSTALPSCPHAGTFLAGLAIPVSHIVWLIALSPLEELIGFLVPGKWLMNISGHGPLFLLGVLFTCLQWAWGFFFMTRKCHFYGYHPVIGTAHWAEPWCKSKWNTKGQLKC